MPGIVRQVLNNELDAAIVPAAFSSYASKHEYYDDYK